jgi:CRP-like cAMP-binding protein
MARSVSVPSRTNNELLDRVPAAVRAELLKQSELVALREEHELFRPGANIRRLFFPTTMVCSLLLGLNSGQRAEMGTVGNEGLVGIPAVLGTRSTEFAVVQIPGEAYAMHKHLLKELMQAHASFNEALMRYISSAYHMAKQTTVCNAYHNIDQRLARWLLACHDRARKDNFPITQELLGHMVAATRPRVTEAAGRLRAAGVIDYERGFLQIKDRKRLEARACECYAATRMGLPRPA